MRWPSKDPDDYLGPTLIPPLRVDERAWADRPPSFRLLFARRRYAPPYWLWLTVSLSAAAFGTAALSAVADWPAFKTGAACALVAQVLLELGWWVRGRRRADTR